MKESKEKERMLDAEYGVKSEEEVLIGGSLIGGEGRGEENIITWHAYMQNIPNKIKEEGKALMEEMQNGFPASKEYFANLYQDMKNVLDPETIAKSAAESFKNMKESFGKLSEYVKNDMGADLSKRFNSFISSVCKSFSEFKEAAKEKMTPAYNKANEAFHDMYTSVIESKAVKQVVAAGAGVAKSVTESKAFKQAAAAVSDVAKSAREYGDGVYGAAMNKKDAKKEKGGRE